VGQYLCMVWRSSSICASVRVEDQPGIRARTIASAVRASGLAFLRKEVLLLPYTFTACHEKALLRPGAWDTDRIIGKRWNPALGFIVTIIVVSGHTDILWAAFVSSHSELELGKKSHAEFVWQHPYHLYTKNAPITELIWSEWDICEGWSEKTSNLNIYQCSICGIDYQIVVSASDSNGTPLLITKWLDLGSGLHQNDPKWKRHLFGSA
jgi:hypothetical protein